MTRSHGAERKVLKTTWWYPRGQRLAAQGGKLSYSTPPLAEGATLSGPISATIYASSSNTNMVLIGRLFDVAPGGTA